MKPLLFVAYVTMAGWMIVAAGRRIALELLHGVQPDWSPFVSGGIALVALLLLLSVYDEGKVRRDR